MRRAEHIRCPTDVAFEWIATKPAPPVAHVIWTTTRRAADCRQCKAGALSDENSVAIVGAEAAARAVGAGPDSRGVPPG
jgi:hypothetical protein